MTFKLGQLSIDASAYGSQGSAILGIRDSGKTYTATLLAEKLFEAGVPLVAFDPIGVWRFLRVPGKGKGYPVVVAGGQQGDLPLTVTGAPEIVRAAMSNGVSLVIDLFDINLSKADWKRIVTSCVKVLLHENSRHGLRHIFIEEAAEFAPQRVGPDQGQVYAEMEKLARMGGNARLGYTLINQRAEEVNKAVLELCDNLFLHRQKGRNSLTALSKWLDIGAVKDHKAIIDTLATLPTGECWAWLGGTERPVHVTVPEKNSLHPDRRVMRGDAAVKRKEAVDVNTFVESMRSSLVTIEKEDRENNPKLLKAEIASLKQQLIKSPKPDMADPAAIEEAERRGFARGWEARIKELADAAARMRAHDSGVTKIAQQLNELSVKITSDYCAIGDRATAASPANRIPQSAPVRLARSPAPSGNGKTVGAQPGARSPSSGDASLTGPQRKLLTVLAQYPDGRTKKQLAILAGYAHSGGAFNNPLARCRVQGLIVGGPERLAITDAGLAALGDWDPLPTGADLREYWLQNLPGPPAKLLRALCEAYPDGMDKATLAKETGYEPTGGAFNNPLARLRSLELVTGRGTAEIRASEDLF